MKEILEYLPDEVPIGVFSVSLLGKKKLFMGKIEES